LLPNPEQLPPGAVLVVGSGNSGCQIADELLHSGRRVFSRSAATAGCRGAIVARMSSGGTKTGPLRCDHRHLSGQEVSAADHYYRRRRGYDLDPRHLGSAGATLLGRVLGITDGTLALADDAAELLAAADKSYAGFIDAADALAATPAMRSELDQKESRHHCRHSMSTVSAH
jgi:putative flavoprotein involved in K+ transport